GLSREENLKNFPLNITAWIAIDDATPLSGTMIFAPGSHRLGVVPYKEVESGTGFHNIGLRFAYEGLFDERDAVTVTVPACSCLLFNNLGFHKSMPNRSNKRRLGIACRYVGSHVPVYRHGDPAGYDISRWACIQVAGKPDRITNKVTELDALELA